MFDRVSNTPANKPKGIVKTILQVNEAYSIRVLKFNMRINFWLCAYVY